MDKIDFVVVGGGIAGVWMHHQLSKYGKCMVIDDLIFKKSSLVAGGIYNPIMLNYAKKAFQADAIYTNLEKNYKEIEKIINDKIVYPTPIKYILNSNENLNQWSVEIEKMPEFCCFTNQINKSIFSEFGCIEVSNSGWVDVKLLIEKYHSFLSEKNEIIILENQNFEKYRNDFNKSKIIYCTGVFNSKFNAFLKPAKGEILIVKSDLNETENIYQQGVFILPLGNGLYKIGSNFEWKNLDSNPTSEARAEIENKLMKFLKCDYEIIDHLAGVRPSSLDRRPILGKLSDSEYVFNGLGSKGVALAPFYSNMLTENIVFDKEIAPNVSLERFYR